MDSKAQLTQAIPLVFTIELSGQMFASSYLRIFTFFSICLLWSCTSKQPEGEPGSDNKSAAKPNIVYVLADDLGYGDLSCYGQSKFGTPNIDKLAARGMRFTQHYSGATVCAPSRSSLMTGLHTGHTPIRGNKGVEPEGQYPIPDSVMTMPELLKMEGYITGGFGKWGLGPPGSEGDPNNQGIDRFFGYNCQSLAHNYFPRHLWNNEEKVRLVENAGMSRGTYAPDLIHKNAMSFIEENKDTSFFLYYPAVIPHAELVAPDSYMDRFRGKFNPEKSYDGYDEGPRYRMGPYGSQPESHAAFVAMITHLDDRVGEIMMLLDEFGIADNTLIIFTSDNGPHLEGGADPDFFDSNGIYKGYKRDLYEGGIRVPMIASWPDRIQPGSTTDHVSAFWDVLPTLLDLIDADPVSGIDGLSFAPTLLGSGIQDQHEYLYWEFHERNGRRAIRQGNWKLVQYNVGIPAETTTELFNLNDDPGESTNLAEDHPDVFNELESKLLQARTPSPVFKFVSD